MGSIRATGEPWDVLRMMYPTMQKYVKACCFWAGFGIGKHRYIWHTPRCCILATGSPPMCRR